MGLFCFFGAVVEKVFPRVATTCDLRPNKPTLSKIKIDRKAQDPENRA